MSNSLDDFSKKLEQMAKSAEELEGTNNVGFDELFTNSFMSQHSKIATIDDFLEGTNIHSQEEFEAYPEDDLDKYVEANTDFSTWQEMLSSGTEAYALKKLGF